MTRKTVETLPGVSKIVDSLKPPELYERGLLIREVGCGVRFGLERSRGSFAPDLLRVPRQFYKAAKKPVRVHPAFPCLKLSSVRDHSVGM